MVARSSARYLAPIALVVVFIVMVVVIASSGGGSSSGGATTARTTARQSAPGRRSYVVKPGDSLLVIASRTGVSINDLEELNPSVDPQALVPGQRIKLRP